MRKLTITVTQEKLGEAAKVSYEFVEPGDQAHLQNWESPNFMTAVNEISNLLNNLLELTQLMSQLIPNSIKTKLMEKLPSEE